MSQISVVPYDEAEHYHELSLWWEGHGLRPIPVHQLPAVGFIVGAVCAGFLYQTDSDVAIIEGLISTPIADDEWDESHRDQSLDLLIKRLCESAHDFGFTTVYGLTQLRAVESRGLRLGFKESGLYRLYEKEL